MDDRLPEPDARAGQILVDAHPVLNVPQHPTAPANVVLTGRVEKPRAVAALVHLLAELAREPALALVPGGDVLFALADHGDGRLPDRRIEQGAQPCGIPFRDVSLVGAVVEERHAT